MKICLPSEAVPAADAAHAQNHRFKPNDDHKQAMQIDEWRTCNWLHMASIRLAYSRSIRSAWRTRKIDVARSLPRPVHEAVGEKNVWHQAG